MHTLVFYMISILLRSKNDNKKILMLLGDKHGREMIKINFIKFGLKFKKCPLQRYVHNFMVLRKCQSPVYVIYLFTYLFVLVEHMSLNLHSGLFAILEAYVTELVERHANQPINQILFGNLVLDP